MDYKHSMLSLTPAAPGTRIRMTFRPKEGQQRGEQRYAPVIGWALVERDYDDGEPADSVQRYVEPVFIAPDMREPVYWSEYHDDWKPTSYEIDLVPEGVCACGG